MTLNIFQSFTLLVIITALIGVYAYVKQTLELKKEIEYLATLKEQLLRIISERGQNDNIYKQYQTLAGHVPTHSITRVFIDELYRAANLQQKLSLPSTEALGLIKSNSLLYYFAQAVPYIVVSLGITGFAYGLMSNLAQTAQIYTPLFITGIMILLLLLARIPYQQLKANYYIKFRQLVQIRIRPLWQTNSQGQQLSELIQHLSGQTNSLRQLVQTLDTTSSEIGSNYKELHSMSKQFTDGLAAYSEIQIMLRQDLSDLKAMLSGREAAWKNQEQLLTSLETINSQQQKLQNYLSTISVDIGDWTSSFVEVFSSQHEQSQKELKGLLEMSRSNMSQTNSAATRFGKSIENFETQLTQLSSTLQNFNEAIQSASEKQVRQLQQTNQHLNKLTESTLEIKGYIGNVNTP